MCGQRYALSGGPRGHFALLPSPSGVASGSAALHRVHTEALVDHRGIGDEPHGSDIGPDARCGHPERVRPVISRQLFAGAVVDDDVVVARFGLELVEVERETTLSVVVGGLLRSAIGPGTRLVS